jgi:hypothetical protein
MLLFPDYLKDYQFLVIIWPLVAASIVMALILSHILGWKDISKTDFFSLFSFALLGTVSGFMAGFSREPVIGAVLPAALSLVGGLVMYLIVGRAAQKQGFVAGMVTALSLTLVLGALWGARQRDVADEYFNSLAYLRAQALEESDLHQYRKNIWLDTDADARPRPDPATVEGQKRQVLAPP